MNKYNKGLIWQSDIAFVKLQETLFIITSYKDQPKSNIIFSSSSRNKVYLIGGREEVNKHFHLRFIVALLLKVSKFLKTQQNGFGWYQTFPFSLYFTDYVLMKENTFCAAVLFKHLCVMCKTMFLILKPTFHWGQKLCAQNWNCIFIIDQNTSWHHLNF